MDLDEAELLVQVALLAMVAGLLPTHRLAATGDRVEDMVPAMDNVSPSVDTTLSWPISLVRRYTDDFCCCSWLSDGSM